MIISYSEYRCEALDWGLGLIVAPTTQPSYGSRS